MTTLRLPSGYDTDRIPAQGAFRRSPAKFRGYGGAMGGGKSYALCQEAWDWALDYPGILLPIFRQKHTAITNTTRKTFMEQVLPSELRDRKDLVRIVESQGKDFIELLWNGSQVWFCGLDDPVKWFSSEIGGAMFDEAHEIAEKDVVTIASRMRQRCVDCGRAGLAECPHMPHKIALSFNPSYPGHWLQQWFVLGAERTEWGFRKQSLIASDAEFPIGDAEFFIARAAENPFLPQGYLEQTLAGMSTPMRRRYLDGLWEHVDGSGFFDQDALAELANRAMLTMPLLVGEPAGSLTGDEADKPRLVEKRTGRLEVWSAPVRWHTTPDGDEVNPHRYVVGIDASTGASSDYSAIQVVSIEDSSQVAEWQGKVDPDRLAEIAFLIGCVYNGALMVPEVNTFGFAVTKRIQTMIAKYRGPSASKPRMYTRPVVDRLTQKFTDKLGWTTTMQSRGFMLDVLEQWLRDGSLEVHGQRTLAELAAFAFPENQTGGDYRPPRARQGAHDDLVIALAIACAVASRLPKQFREPQVREYVPQFEATGF